MISWKSERMEEDKNAGDVPLVSVVMSVFQGERYLKCAMDSILEQTFRDFEFIIIDDGSTDCSRSILESYKTKDPRVKVCSQENRGLIYSLNRGCKLARGKYIARMDADDIAVPNRFGWQVAYMEAHPATGLLGGAVEFINAGGKTLRISRYPNKNAELQPALLDGNAMWHPTVMMRRDVYSALGGYRNVLDAEDYDLWLRMGERSELANLPFVLLKYRIHAAQISVLKYQQQALGTVAARAFAMARRSGKPDPLRSMKQITSASLTKIGVSKTVQEKIAARSYLSCVRNLCRAGDIIGAFQMVHTLDALNPDQIETWVLADLLLWKTRLFWRRRQLKDSVTSLAHALIKRPKLIGRPLKLLFSRLRYMLRDIRLGEKPLGRIALSYR